MGWTPGEILNHAPSCAYTCAQGRRSAKELDVAWATVGAILVSVEGRLLELLLAKRAVEALGVELHTHGRDTAPHHGLGARRAHVSGLLVIVVLAVRQPVMLVCGTDAHMSTSVINFTLFIFFFFF